MNTVLDKTNLEILFNRISVNTDLSMQYEQALQENPQLRRRDLATKLSITEAAIIDAQLGIRSLRLNNNFASMLEKMPSLEYVMTLVRNESTVHERKGIYDNVKVHGGQMGLVISSDKKIDLRLFLKRWAHAFAVYETGNFGDRFSLQFFDSYGTAIQKIFIQKKENHSDYEAFINTFLHGEQNQTLQFDKIDESTIGNELTDDEIESDRVKEAWNKMTDVHQLMGILNRFKLGREQILRVVGNESAVEFPPQKLESLLLNVAKSKLSIMCFVGNHGCIQIHTGAINKVKTMGDWLNILDPEFNLHIAMNTIVRAWHVKKPTEDGPITSLEFYDANETLVLQFFGKRTEGYAEDEKWVQLAGQALTD